MWIRRENDKLLGEINAYYCADGLCQGYSKKKDKSRRILPQGPVVLHALPNSGKLLAVYFTNRGDAGVKTTVIDWEKL